jgi:hypothetical protein
MVRSSPSVFLAASLTLATLSLSTPARAQISNGSFETSTPTSLTFGTAQVFTGSGSTYNNIPITSGNTTLATGWTADFDPNGQGWLVQRPAGDPLIPTFGNRFIYLNGWESCYRQTLSLVVGQRYTLSACIAGLDQDGTPGDESARFAFEVDLDRVGGASYAGEYNVQTVAATDVRGNFSGAVWKTYSYTFTAAGSGSGLQNYDFWLSALNTNTSYATNTAPTINQQLGIAVDCLTIQSAAPEPSSLCFLLIAGAFLPLRRFRVRRTSQP